MKIKVLITYIVLSFLLFNNIALADTRWTIWDLFMDHSTYNDLNYSVDDESNWAGWTTWDGWDYRLHWENILDNTLTSEEILDNDISEDDIWTDAVWSDEIIDNSIQWIDIWTNAVWNDEIKNSDTFYLSWLYVDQSINVNDLTVTWEVDMPNLDLDNLESEIITLTWSAIIEDV